MLLPDLTDDLLNCVLGCDHPDHRAKLVHHCRHLIVPSLKFPEQLIKILGFGNEFQIVHERFQTKRRVGAIQQLPPPPLLHV